METRGYSIGKGNDYFAKNYHFSVRLALASNEMPQFIQMLAFREPQIVRMCWSPLKGNPMSFTLFLMYFDATQFDDQYFEAFDIVYPVHIARAVRQRKAEFLCGRLCARAALRELGLVGKQVAIGSMREPLWPKYIAGSIAHSKTIAAAVAVPLTHWHAVGIDVEEFVDIATLDILRGSVLSAQEWSYLCVAAVPAELKVLVTLVFSAKESFFKATCGMLKRYFDFDVLEFVGINWVTQVISFRVTQSLGVQWRLGDDCQIGFQLLDKNHVLTVFAY